MGVGSVDTVGSGFLIPVGLCVGRNQFGDAEIIVLSR